MNKTLIVKPDNTGRSIERQRKAQKDSHREKLRKQLEQSVNKMIDSLKDGRSYLPRVQRTLQSTDASTTHELTEQSVTTKGKKATIT